METFAVALVGEEDRGRLVEAEEAIAVVHGRVDNFEGETP